MEETFRIVDFNVYNAKQELDEDDTNIFKDTSNFEIQMFGLNEHGETCSIIVEGFKPFFYVLVDDHWNIKTKETFLSHIKMKMGKYYENSITDCIIIKRKKLYGFDAGKEYKFVKLEFTSISAFNKAKNLWYTSYQYGHILMKDGYKFENGKNITEGVCVYVYEKKPLYSSLKSH
jgi:hypothetical protein